MEQALDNKLIQILLAIAITLILQFVGQHTIKQIVRRAVKRSKDETSLDEKKRENTIIAVLRTTFAAALWILTICAILTILGVNVAALLTGAGLIGVFAGLSAQNTIKDFLGGMFILLEHQYRVGDTITLAGGTTGVPGTTGRVEEITLRITKLRDLSGNLITIRNGEPTIISNKTFSYSSTVLDLTFTYDSDVKTIEKVIDKIGADLAKDKEWADLVRSPIKFIRVDNFADNGVIVRAIGEVAPASQWDIAGEFRKRLLIEASNNPKVQLAHS